MKPTSARDRPASDGSAVERIDGSLLGDRFDVEEPIVEITSETMHQDDGITAVTT
jgi:hypothetical protein